LVRDYLENYLLASDTNLEATSQLEVVLAWVKEVVQSADNEKLFEQIARSAGKSLFQSDSLSLEEIECLFRLFLNSYLRSQRKRPNHVVELQALSTGEFCFIAEWLGGSIGKLPWRVSMIGFCIMRLWDNAVAVMKGREILEWSQTLRQAYLETPQHRNSLAVLKTGLPQVEAVRSSYWRRVLSTVRPILSLAVNGKSRATALLQSLAFSLRINGDVGEAVDLYDDLVSEFSPLVQDTPHHYDQGMVLLFRFAESCAKNSDYHRIIRVLAAKICIDGAPAPWWMWQCLAGAYEAQSSLQDAIETCRRTVEKNGSTPSWPLRWIDNFQRKKGNPFNEMPVLNDGRWIRMSGVGDLGL
jgi:hypothetical protein